MTAYALRRTAQAVLILIGASLFLHAMVFWLPGDPIRALFGFTQPDPEVLAELRAAYHLDEPFLVQWLRYLGGAVQGDFGQVYGRNAFGAIVGGRPVTAVLVSGFGPTAWMLAVAVGVQVVFGITLGVVAALRRRSPLSAGVIGFSVLAIAIPTFVLASLVADVLPLSLTRLPNGDLRSGPLPFLVPGAILAVTPTAYVMRLARVRMREQLSAPYVALGEAKGLRPERVVWLHTLRNALPTVVTLIGAEIGPLLGALTIVEGVFRIRGLGGSLYTAIRAHQGPLIISITTVFVAITIAANLLADLVAAGLDPRVRRSLSGRRGAAAAVRS